MYRKATVEDCKKVYELICELEKKELPFERFSEIFQEQLNNEKYYCLVCECDGHVVGVLNLRFEGQLHHSDYIAEIMEFAVDADYRKHGIGKGMFAQACRIAEDYNCIQIECSSNQLRTDAHRFYIREGMHNYHYKFTKSLTGEDRTENKLGC